MHRERVERVARGKMTPEEEREEALRLREKVSAR